jgi:hypothetical protein
MPELAEWKFPNGGWVQVYRLAEGAGGCSCTFVLDDLDQMVTHLKELGIETGEQMKSEQMKVIMIKDPAGNSLSPRKGLPLRVSLQRVSGSLFRISRRWEL